MEKAKEEVSKMHECPNYNDCAFPVSMHTITKYDIFPNGRVINYFIIAQIIIAKNSC